MPGSQWLEDGEFQAVLGGARAGDEDAFASLWRRFNPSLLRFLTTLAGPDDNVAEVASTVWLEVVRGLDRFTGDEAGFRGWLFTMGRRRLIDVRRARARRPERSSDHDRADLRAERRQTRPRPSKRGTRPGAALALIGRSRLTGRGAAPAGGGRLGCRHGGGHHGTAPRHGAGAGSPGSASAGRATARGRAVDQGCNAMTATDGARHDALRLRTERSPLDLDETPAEALAAGHIGSDDARPAYAPVARAARFRQRSGPGERLGAEQSIRAMSTRERGPLTLRRCRRARAHGRTASEAADRASRGPRPSGQTGGVAAAATGHLPEPAQAGSMTRPPPRDHRPGRRPGPPSRRRTRLRSGTYPTRRSRSHRSVRRRAGQGDAVRAQASHGTCQAGEHDRRATGPPPTPVTPVAPA